MQRRTSWLAASAAVLTVGLAAIGVAPGLVTAGDGDAILLVPAEPAGTSPTVDASPTDTGDDPSDAAPELSPPALEAAANVTSEGPSGLGEAAADALNGGGIASTPPPIDDLRGTGAIPSAADGDPTTSPATAPDAQAPPPPASRTTPPPTTAAPPPPTTSDVTAPTRPPSTPTVPVPEPPSARPPTSSPQTPTAPVPSQPEPAPSPPTPTTPTTPSAPAPAEEVEEQPRVEEPDDEGDTDGNRGRRGLTEEERASDGDRGRRGHDGDD